MLNLFNAIRNNDLPNIQNLLANGANVNAQDNYGYTPLLFATFHNRLEIIILLLENGADANIPDNSGNTPLLRATWRNNLEAIKILLAKGADPNIHNNHKNTPLIIAASNNHSDVMKLLINNGANINAQDIDGETPLIEAALGNNLEAMTILITKGADVNMPDYNGDTPLLKAVLGNKLDAMTMLIKYGADLNAQDQNKNTALMIAEIKAVPEIINILKLTLNIDNLLAGKEVNDIDPSQIELFLDILKARAFTHGVDSYAAVIKALNQALPNDLLIQEFTNLLSASKERIDEFESIIRGEIEGISTMPASLVKKGIKQKEEEKIEENDFDYRPAPDTLKYYAGYPEELEVVGTYLKQLDPVDLLTKLKNEDNTNALELFATIFTNADFSNMILPTSLKVLLETLMPTFNEVITSSLEASETTNCADTPAPEVTTELEESASDESPATKRARIDAEDNFVEINFTTEDVTLTGEAWPTLSA